jgi:ubiquinone/menaquinone biosynthesis C-methylase UbiE
MGYEKDFNHKEIAELTHKVFSILNKGHLHQSPLVEPGLALDIGCGSGIWTREFGDHCNSLFILCLS